MPPGEGSGDWGYDIYVGVGQLERRKGISLGI